MGSFKLNECEQTVKSYKIALAVYKKWLNTDIIGSAQFETFIEKIKQDCKVSN